MPLTRPIPAYLSPQATAGGTAASACFMECDPAGPLGCTSGQFLDSPMGDDCPGALSEDEQCSTHKKRPRCFDDRLEPCGVVLDGSCSDLWPPVAAGIPRLLSAAAPTGAAAPLEATKAAGRSLFLSTQSSGSVNVGNGGCCVRLGASASASSAPRPPSPDSHRRGAAGSSLPDGSRGFLSDIDSSCENGGGGHSAPSSSSLAASRGGRDDGSAMGLAAKAAAGQCASWADIPDDLLRRVLAQLQPSYLRVFRLVCRPWEQMAGRFIRSLKPERLRVASRTLSERFPYVQSLDLSDCVNIVTCHRANELRLRSALTDGMLACVAGMTRLTDINLRGCSSITGEGAWLWRARQGGGGGSCELLGAGLA